MFMWSSLHLFGPFIEALGSVALLLAGSTTLQAAAPNGWSLAGGSPTQFGIDALAPHNGYPSAYLRSRTPRVDGFGTLMQDFRAEHYLGKRVRFSAFVKTQSAQYRAGLWMRIDKGSQQVGFDNMSDRPIRGTTGWQKYDVLLDVPLDATSISLGVLLIGSGEVWLNDAKFKVVGPRVLATNGDVVEKPDEPTNLDFDQ